MKRLIGYTVAFCLLALMVGCGGVTSTGTLAYVSNSTGTGFTVFTVNSDGTLTKSSISPQNTPAAPKVLRFSANGKWAYFLDDAGLNLYGYLRAGNGSLTTQIGVFPISGNASSLVISPNNTFIYVSLKDTQRLAVFSIDAATGNLSQVSNSFDIGYSVNQLVMAPGGSVLYALSTGQQAVLSFGLNASSGFPTLSGNQTVGSTPDYLVLSANGSYLYVLDSTATTTIPATPTTAAYTTPNIYGFNTSGNGVLTQMVNSPFLENPDTATGGPKVPVAGATSNDTRYLFVANQVSHNISIFKISPTSGELNEILNTVTVINGTPITTGSPFDCGNGCTSPSFVTVTSANNGLYLIDSAPGANKIFQYKINQNNGTLRAQNPASVIAESSTSNPTWITIR